MRVFVLRTYKKLERITARRLRVEYVLIPKVASNSIRAAVRRADVAVTRHPKHTTPKFVFTFVRHPLSRLASAYIEKIRTGKFHTLVSGRVEHDLSNDMSMADFVDHLVSFYDKYKGVALNDHFCPQSWLVNSAPDISFVGRLENIQQDWNVLIDKGLGPLGHRHKTQNIKKWQDLLDGPTEAKARRFYHEDFDRWGWE